MPKKFYWETLTCEAALRVLKKFSAVKLVCQHWSWSLLSATYWNEAQLNIFLLLPFCHVQNDYLMHIYVCKRLWLSWWGARMHTAYTLYSLRSCPALQAHTHSSTPREQCITSWFIQLTTEGIPHQVFKYYFEVKQLKIDSKEGRGKNRGIKCHSLR